MSTFILFWVLAAPPDLAKTARETRESPPAKTQTDSHRPFHEISQDLRGLLRQEAQSTDPDQWRTVVVQLVRLYGELTHDERLPTSDTLTAYRIQLRSRLLRIQRRLERNLRAKEMAAKENSQRVLASAAESRADHELPTAPSASPAESLSQSSAGATCSAATRQGAAGGAPRGDYGDDLVELIRSTISPDFWDVNGGPGTIVYYRQWQVLVVRATIEVHERIGGAVFGLRE